MFNKLFKFILCLQLILNLLQAQAQGNYVKAGSEAVIFSNINLSTPGGQIWSTQRTVSPGYFSMYGTAAFTGAADGGTALIDGYVKHYATAASQGAVFPVGAGTGLRTLTTAGNIPSGMQVATAWILGDPTSTIDPTDGITHSTGLLADDVLAVSTIGQWDWVDISNTSNSITVTVNIPNVIAFGVASQFRLVGWNGAKWINLSATQGTTAASGNTAGSTLTGTMQSGITAIGIGKGFNIVHLKIFLQGGMSGPATMTNYLTTSAFVPASQPFNDAYFNYTGTEANAIQSTSAAVTDWVLIELRSTVFGAAVDTRAAFVRTDGIVIDALTGLPGVQFANAVPGNYYVIVHHRNHLSVVSASAISLPNTAPTLYDFTTGLAQALDNGTGNSMKETSAGVWAMWFGDYNHDQTIDALDRSFILTEFNQGLIDGYFVGDLNFDGFVDAVDRSFIFSNYLIGLSSPIY